ncbi:MAG: NUDIX hydrolase [Bacteroidetes bacterium]|nr:NUDIX hydrolase [Bacteroidota bacterium]
MKRLIGKPLRFNVRVYGVWIAAGKVLVSEEQIFGETILKFTGGGVELGEGLIDALKREWQEELGVEIEVLQHLYTTDFFQLSAFDDSQVVSVYYRVQAVHAPATLLNRNFDERVFWLPLRDIDEQTFSLPIDKVVAALIRCL